MCPGPCTLVGRYCKSVHRDSRQLHRSVQLYNHTAVLRASQPRQDLINTILTRHWHTHTQAANLDHIEAASHQTNLPLRYTHGAQSLDRTTCTPRAQRRKAYYRKCIALKRRLNEVEAANDEAKIRRARLDRSIMKMRLERAFLLDELRKRMDYNVDGSEASGDEGIQTPPQDRPYRDKRRRQQSGTGAAQGGSSAGTFQTVQYQPGPSSTRPSSGQGNAPMMQGPGGQMVQANAVDDANRPVYVDQYGNPPPLGQGSPDEPPPTGLPSSTAATNGTGANKEEIVKDGAGESGKGEGAQSTAFNPVNS